MKDIKATVSIIGLGIRGGEVYGKYIRKAYAQYPIRALCDIQPKKMEKYATEFGVSRENCFSCEEQFFERKRSDILIVATPDKTHIRIALKALSLGYHVLLETPASDNLQDLRELSMAAKKAGKVILLANVLRYSTAIRKMREVIKSGVIGELVSVDYTENVGFWHAAHSYVRGSWSKSADVPPMIMTKCCHDFDILLYLIDGKCVRISSMGSRLYFKKQKQPAGAAERCVACPYMESCPYSAKRIYVDMWRTLDEEAPWPMSAITDVRPVTEAALRKAIEEGPYGRCVFTCDNDVVDNQVTAMQFESGATATLKMEVFSKDGGREIKVHGSLGELSFCERDSVVRQRLFFGQDVEWRISEPVGYDNDGGSNRDERLIDAFFKEIERGTDGVGAQGEFEENHYMALAAEESRLNDGKAIDLLKYRNGDSALQSILDYIDTHYLEDVTIRSLAREVGYSEGYCSKLLKAFSGDSFREYLNKKRLKRVDELLSDKTLDLTWLEIIYKSGFNCPSTYYRTKKRHSKK